MITQAAVFREIGAPLSIEPITLDPPRATEVQVKVKAVGLCRTDQHVMRGECRVAMAPMAAMATWRRNDPASCDRLVEHSRTIGRQSERHVQGDKFIECHQQPALLDRRQRGVGNRLRERDLQRHVARNIPHRTEINVAMLDADAAYAVGVFFVELRPKSEAQCCFCLIFSRLIAASVIWALMSKACTFE
jgi:hypothetical protein